MGRACEELGSGLRGVHVVVPGPQVQRMDGHQRRHDDEGKPGVPAAHGAHEAALRHLSPPQHGSVTARTHAVQEGLRHPMTLVRALSLVIPWCC